jgi:hypothetical protein
MKKFFGLILLVIVARPAFADFGDSIAKVFFQNKVDQIYEKAILCSPLEKDSKSSMDVSDWIKIQPTLPSWQMLTDIEQTAKDARNYARSKGGNDKVLHCLAGCYVAKKLDYTSAVLVGWFKELSDSSDCTKNTSFEKKDYDATVKGAHAGRDDKECASFCKRK